MDLFKPHFSLMKTIVSVILIFTLFNNNLSGNTVVKNRLDADHLFEKISINPNFLSYELKPEYLTGDATIETRKNETFVQFHSRTKDSLVIVPKYSQLSCPWDLKLCTDSLSVSFKLTKTSEESFYHILTIALNDKTRISISRNDLEGRFYFQIQARDILTRIYSVAFNKISNSISVNAQFDLKELRLKNVSLDEKVSNFLQVPTPNADLPEIAQEESFIGIVFGDSTGTFEVGNFDIDVGGEKKITKRNSGYYSQQGNIMRVGNVAGLGYSKSGYVTYDFRNTDRVPSARHQEKISIKFILPYGNTEGILWKAKGDKSETLIYIKDSKLYYFFRSNNSNEGASRTITEEVVLNKELRAGVIHHLTMDRNNEELTVKLDEVQQGGILTENSALLPERGILYLGGSPNLFNDSGERVRNPFLGNISQVHLIIDNNANSLRREFDLIKMTTDPNWRSIVVPNGHVEYQVDISAPADHRNLVIGPTAGYEHPTDSIYQKQSVYLDGSNQAVVRASTWDFDKRPFFEIEFRTLEPEGILFFVGPDDQHTDFICVEIYDGNIYFVYGIQYHYRHIQLNPDSEKVNNGNVHRVYVERTPDNRLITKFNGRDVDVDQKDNIHVLKFSTYTYFGSIDQPGRLPWYVWARKNFAGCILSVRIGENNFLDFTLIMNQHNDATTGVYLECKIPKRICTQRFCGAGQCYDRSEPFYKDHERFSCDCSSTDQTYKPTTSILKSEKCARSAPILQFDGKSSRLIEFENVKKTHTDDFRLQFKTSEPNAPLFHTYSPNANQYFKVDLYNGKIKIHTNMNRGMDDPGDKLFSLEESPVLSDNQWHVLKVNRRAQYLTIDVDDRYSKVGEIPIKDGRNFNLIAQYLFLGSEAPNYFNNFNIQDFTDYDKVDSSKIFFKGEMRNFYWNEYDLSGNPNMNRVYSTHEVAPKFKPPSLPPFRGAPNYFFTATAKLISVPILRRIDLENLGDTFMFHFKTKYDGNIIHVQMIDEAHRELPEFAVILLDDKLYFVYNFGNEKGVYQWKDNQDFSDNQWHRLAISLNRRDGQIVMSADNREPQYIDKNFNFDNLGTLKMSVAGVADSTWRGIFEVLRMHYPSSKIMHYTQRSPPFTGCVGGLLFKSEQFSSDWLQVYSNDLSPSPSSNDIIPGKCLDVDRCTPEICNHGQCEENSHDHTITCRCQPGYYGSRCENRGETCYQGFCQNDGECTIINTRRSCDCRNTGFTGPRCERSPCDENYCGHGKCTMIGKRPQCECYGSGYTGDRCEVHICRPGICGAGTCRVSLSNQPECDCYGTGFKGARCDIPLCKPNPCKNGGICQISGNDEVCDCKGTGYKGQYCVEPTCENNHNYCLNRGICRVDPYKNALVCDCQNTGYTGQRCQHPIVEINPCDNMRCYNGGRCLSRDGRAQCDCSGTGFQGPLCEMSVCSQSKCVNGVCEVRNGSPSCRCNQGYRGIYCSEEDCFNGFCMNGGNCYVFGSRRQCECPMTFEGPRCEHQKQCKPDYCLHGRCRVMSNGNYQCDCDPGYTGDKCENSASCPYNYCNGGKCTVTSSGSFVCDCSPTGRGGDRCQEDSNAFLSEYKNPGYLVYDLYPPKRYTKDTVTVGFKTYAQDGTIISFESPDKSFWSLRMDDGSLLFDENGRKPIIIKQGVNNGVHHVVRVDRVDKLVNITMSGISVQNTLDGYGPPDNSAIEYKRIIIGANATEEDIFRGAIGGVHWNGYYIIDKAKEHSPKFDRGQITYVRLPSFSIPRPPSVYCHPGYCENRGTCEIVNYEKKCECKFIGYWGDRCEKQYYGYLDNDRNEGTYTKLVLNPERTTSVDQMRYAFQTREPNGVLTHVEQADGNVYHQTFLENGYLWSNLNGNKNRISDFRMDDGKYHIVNLDRENNQFKYYVDGNHKTISDPNIVNSNGELQTKNIYVGADSNGNSNFKGVLGAFSWNDQEIINKEGRITQNTQVMKLPGNRAGSSDEVVITVMPAFDTDVGILPPIPIPSNVPNTGGGSIISPNGDFIVAGNQEGLMAGGGQAGIFPGGGTRIQTAGFAGGLPQISALAAGIILSLLLCLSGLIWACWKCKPGGCGQGGAGSGFIKKAASVFGGAGEKDAYIGRGGNPYQNIGGMDVEEQQVNETMLQPMNNNEIMMGNETIPNYDHVTEGSNLLMNSAGAGMGSGMGAGMGGGYGGGTFVSNVGHGKMLDMSPGMDMNSYRMRQNFTETGGPNVYSTDMKVDCCEISQNSKYAVTGSANGPPQVWDMVSGELFKVMDGSELAARDLHLGCNDQVLVGQVVDENDMDSYIMSNGNPVRRLQLWHFQTGQQMEMQEKIMCSASCLTTRDKNDLIVARTQPKGDSILVWDLIGNENKQEIFYNRISDSPVTFLKVSLDDRLVVAGFENGEDQPCTYMVFDLCAEHSQMIEPNRVDFDAEVNATEILSDFEAITGTRKGHLFVWNIHTCEAIRQIQISAVIEDNTLVALPAHNDLIHCVTLSKDGQYIVTGSRDQTVKVWKRSEERLLHCLEGHNDDVLSTFISPDSEVIVSGSWDGSIRVWRLRDGNQMCWFTSNIEILQVKLSNDKRAIVGLGERNGNRKLIMLQIIRNRTTVYGPNESLSPSLGPASP